MATIIEDYDGNFFVAIKKRKNGAKKSWYNFRSEFRFMPDIQLKVKPPKKYWGRKVRFRVEFLEE